MQVTTNPTGRLWKRAFGQEEPLVEEAGDGRMAEIVRKRMGRVGGLLPSGVVPSFWRFVRTKKRPGKKPRPSS